MRDANGSLSYRAVQKNELETCELRLSLLDMCWLTLFFFSKKGLSGEENMVLGHIQAAANQGDPEPSHCFNTEI